MRGAPAPRDRMKQIASIVPFANRQALVERQLAGHGIHSLLQPIVSLVSGRVIAHECLIRGNEGYPLQRADELFAAARQRDCELSFEERCLQTGTRTWIRQGSRGLLFANLSADALLAMHARGHLSAAAEELAVAGVAPSSVVIEITEHQRVVDLARLLTLAAALRKAGVRFALDDFGDGRSSLRLWAELRPEFVKVDKYFVHQVQDEAVKVQTLRGLMRLAELFDTQVIAEGIETVAELRVVRDLGIHYGQGYLLGRPGPTLLAEIEAEPAEVIRSRSVAVLPEIRRLPSREFALDRIVERVPPVSPDCTVNELSDRFVADPELRALPFVRDEQALALITRQTLTELLNKQFFRDIYGRRPAMPFAAAAPHRLDRSIGIDAAAALLTSADQRYLTDGFIVTDNGRYLGLASGQQLVRMVTEARIEAARHANPLTLLPGNIPISEHIGRLLQARCPFVACYADLNHFKPFNDHYGYWRGDDMIQLLARTLVSHADPRRDFVGHVGGDDFVVLFQSDDWFDRCQEVVRVFNAEARNLYDAAAHQRGGIDAEDRSGVMRFFAFCTLAIGAATVEPGRFTRAEQVATIAAAAKHRAKQSANGLTVEVA